MIISPGKGLLFLITLFSFVDSLLIAGTLLTPGMDITGGKIPYALLVKDYSSPQEICYDPEGFFSQLIFPGSLMKVFSILAKYNQKDYQDDKGFFCRGYGPGIGDSEKCWLKAGHGKLYLTQAVAYSCNSYFYQFFQDADYERFLLFMSEEGVVQGSASWVKAAQNRDEKIETMMGRKNYLKIKPERLLDFYYRLVSGSLRVQDRLREQLLEGLRGVYIYGTASIARKRLTLSPDLPFYCKTGTGLYILNNEIDNRRTHGFFLAIYQNRIGVLVMVPDSRGADEASMIGLAYMRKLDNLE